MKTYDNKCRVCGTRLIGKNAIDVGYCLPCYAIMMSDDSGDEEDFGCAIKAGLGHLLNKPL